MSEEIFSPLRRVVRGFRKCSFVFAIITFIYGAVTFAGWMLAIPLLRDFPGVIIPRTNTTFCMMVCSAALMVLISPIARRRRAWLVRLLAGFVAVVGALTLLEHISGVDLGIDQLLARDDTNSTGVLQPNRMGPPAAANFVFLGLALWLQTYRRESTQKISQLVCLLVVFVSLVPMLGYLYGVSELYAISRYTAVSWSTALSHLLLALGVTFAFADSGYFRAFVIDDPGGLLLRQVLLPIVSFTIFVGYLRITGERMGFYDAPMGTALRVLVSISLYCLLIYMTSRALTRYAAESERQKHLLTVTLSSISDGVIVTNAQGQVIFMNPEAQRLTGWSQADAVGQPLSSVYRIIHEETRQPVESPVEKVLRKGATVTLTNHTLLQARDGREIPIDDSGAPVRTADGQILGVVLDFRDYSEKKAVQRALEQSEKRYHGLVERLPDALCISRDQRIVFANAAAVKLFGTAQEQIIGHSPESLLSPDDPGIIAQRLAFLGDGQAIDSFEKKLVRNDGERRQVEITAIPFVDAEGAAIQWVLRDVTERNQTAHALSQAKNTAEQANAAKDHFLAVLSHELRTPLTPALAATAMMLRDQELKEDLREQAELIYRNIELEARLVDDLLDVTRITQGKIELHRRPVALNHVIQHAVEVCQSDIGGKRLELRILMPDESPVVLGDATRLQQVFWNLLRNAIKFTPECGLIQLRCFVDDAGHYAVAEVQDNGVGIDPETLPRLFSAFEQGAHRVTRQFGGLGLGLAISRTMAELHGGTIEADSPGKDRGAIFRVRLPLIAGNAHVEPERVQPASHADVMPLRILLVEDHPDTARVMKRLLLADGHKVQVAGTVAAAMALVESQTFDLLLSDLGLPDGSGHDLMRSLRSHGIKLPGIAISGYGQPSDIARSREVGFAGHLTKPVNPMQLTRTIETVLSTL